MLSESVAELSANGVALDAGVHYETGEKGQAKFIEQFELDPTVVKKKAEAIYAALNPTAHDESPWALFDIDFTIGEKEIDATIPSLTKVFANYLEFYDIDRDTFVNMFFDIEDGDGGMDI